MSTASDYRPRLEAVRSRNRAARQRRKELTEMQKLARSVGDHDAEQVAAAALRDCEADLSDATTLENTLLRQLSGTGGSVGADSFLNDPATIQTLEQLASSSMPIGNLMLGPAMGRDEYVSELQRNSVYAAAGTADVPDSARMQAPYGIIPALRRPIRLLDLISVQTMSGGSFTYVREGGNFDQGAMETIEGTVKPEDTGLDLSLTGTVTAVTIAAWKRLKRQILADLPGLGTLINSRLMYSVARRTEAQILAGDGVGPNLLGILATTGIAAISFNAAKSLSDLILDGITAVRLSNAEPDGIVLNPSTWSAMLSAKASGSGERLDSGGAFTIEGSQLWGIPVVVSTAVSPTTAVVGAWHQAATMFVREGVNLRISDSDTDAFIRNELVVLAESRVGLAVFQPAGFAKVALA